MKKILIKIKKKIFRAVLYIFYPKRCIPRVIHYDNKEWYLAESTKPSNLVSGKMAIYVSYIRFEKDETIYLMEVSDFNRGSAAYRELYRTLRKLRIL